jgi:hypothetical protein
MVKLDDDNVYQTTERYEQLKREEKLKKSNESPGFNFIVFTIYRLRSDHQENEFNRFSR